MRQNICLNKVFCVLEASQVGPKFQPTIDNRKEKADAASIWQFSELSSQKTRLGYYFEVALLVPEILALIYIIMCSRSSFRF